MTATAAASPPKGEFIFIPRTRLEPSPTNPRKTFDPERLAELARTVAEHGIVEPILARPHPTKKGEQLEIVAGERRWRAAELAKLEAVPVIVRPLTDKQALEIQTIENAQREDLHPLEQADGYERLIKDFGYTPEKIADAIGKSRAHVFQIRKLRSLAPKLREAFLAGDMDTTLATVFALVPGNSLQEKAWQEPQKQFSNGFSFRHAAEFVRKNYMLDLARAPFPIADATLHPQAGACGACPKRTGNQADLFPDVKNGNVCTDPQCFDFKRTAHQQRTVKKLEAGGTVVITGKEAKQALPYHWSRLDAWDSPVVNPNDRCYEDKERRTYGQLAKLAGISLAQLQNPHDGELQPVVRVPELKKALAGKGIVLSRGSTSTPDRAARLAREKALEERVKRRSEARRLTWLATRDKVTKLDTKDLVAIAAQFYGKIWGEYQKRINEAWKWPHLGERAIAARIGKLKPAELSRLLVDLTLVPELTGMRYGGNESPLLKTLARRHGVSFDTIAARLEKEAKLKKAAKAAAAKQKARKAPGKVKAIKAAKPKPAAPKGAKKKPETKPAAAGTPRKTTLPAGASWPFPVGSKA